MKSPSVRKVLQTMTVRSKHSVAAASEWDKSLPTTKAITEMKYIYDAYTHVWKWHGFDSDLFLRSSVSKHEVEAQMQAACNVFMDNPIMAIESAYALAPGKSDHSKVVHATQTVVSGLSPFTVAYNGSEISLVHAFLKSKKCSSCSSLRLTCDQCCFSDAGPHSDEDTICKWLSVVSSTGQCSNNLKNKIHQILASDKCKVLTKKKI